MATDPGDFGSVAIAYRVGLEVTPIHGRVSRGGSVVLTRGRRHSGGGMGGMGYRGGSHCYAEQVAVKHAATSSQAPASQMRFRG